MPMIFRVLLISCLLAGTACKTGSDLYVIKVKGDAGKFSGSYMVIDSGSATSHSVNGYAPETFTARGSIVSVAFQKQSNDDRKMIVSIERDGVVVKEQSTSAEYGMVTIATNQ